MKKLIMIIVLALGVSTLNAQFYGYFGKAETGVFKVLKTGPNPKDLTELTDYTEIYVTNHFYYYKAFFDVVALSKDAPKTGVRIELEFSPDTSITTDGFYIITLKGVNGEEIIIAQAMDADYWSVVSINGFRGPESTMVIYAPISSNMVTYDFDEFEKFMGKLDSLKRL